MADQSGSTRFRARFRSALQTYQQTTGVTLAEHPLAVQLQSCCSVESITTILTHEVRSPGGNLGSDGIVKSIESIVSILFTLSNTAAFGDAIGLVRQEAPMTCFHTPDGYSQLYPPARAILAGLAILFAVCTTL
jgi:hypothetical protein